MPTRAILLHTLLVVLFQTAMADPEVGKSEVPDWVEELEIEEFASDRSGEFQLGVAYLLSDRQIRKSSDGYDYYERLAYKVIDRLGLENSATIAQSFDPTNQTLSFNFVRVIRNGEIIDRLADAEITLLRQEEGLNSSLIDGNITALIQLDDVRVGDLIDYSFGGTVVSRLWPNDLFESASVGWFMPVAQMRFKLIVPEDLEVTARGVSTDTQPRVTQSNGWKSFELHTRDPDPIRIEQNVPEDWTPYGFIVFSTMDSWSDIVDWALPLFEVDDPLPPEYIVQLDSIADTYPRRQDRTIHALRLVQEDIRYLGLEVGLGSHVPRPPAVTIERGYGDCKDKSVLLISALTYLGIDAFPALASATGGKSLPQVPPTIDAFNHVIVGINIGDQKYWVDPTLSHQGGSLETLAPLGYGYVLPIRRGQSQLVELEIPLADSPTTEIVETFEFPEAGNVGLGVTAEYTYRNVAADLTRLMLTISGRDNLTRSFLDYYAANYKGLTESRPLTIADDIDANVLIFRAEYEMDSRTFRDSDYGNKLPVHATAVRDLLPRQVEAERVAPLRLPYGTNARHIVRIVIPGRKMFLPESKSKSVAGVSYAQDFRDDGEAFEIEFTLAVSEEVAEPDSIRSVTDLADEIAEDSEMYVNVSRAVPSLSRQLELTTPLDRETESAIMLVLAQIARKEHVQALTSLNTLVGANEEPTKVRGYLQLLRAMVLVQLGRQRAAMEPFDEAFELYEPTEPDGYFRYIGILAGEREDARVVQMITRLLEHHPAAVDNFNTDWVSRFARNLRQSELTTENDTLVVAIARALHETQAKKLDDFRWIFVPATEILSRKGDVSEASEYLPYVKDPEVLAKLLSNRETKVIWDAIEDDAGAGLSNAISRYVSDTRDAARAAPDDFDSLTRHLEALRMAGQFQEAVDFADPVIQKWPQIEAVGEDAYWFVNEYAYTLSYGGFPERAHALMDRLVAMGIAENSPLISMAINRAQLLLHWGDFEAVLQAIDEIESLGSSVASDYGWMWIYEAKACALHQLNRTEEAKTIVTDSIMPIAGENPAAHTKTLLCLDEMDEAADIIIGRLKDDAKRGNVILSFIEVADPKAMPPFLAELRDRADQVRARPKVREEFDKVGRVVAMNGTSTYWGIF